MSKSIIPKFRKCNDMTQFSVTKNGEIVGADKYTWDKDNKIFSTKEEDLVIDFGDTEGITFTTGDYCIFSTGNHCTFKTGSNCTFSTGANCTFTTRNNCIFSTGSNCTFKTGYNCTFSTWYSCIFDIKENCVLIRRDVIGVTEIPSDKRVKLNSDGISGYTEVKKQNQRKKKQLFLEV